MFYWPRCELTEYELQFVRYYKTDNFPGVLRRSYGVILNSLANPNVPGLEQAKTSGQVQISRRSRVFGLSFAGDTSCWRLGIGKANGEDFTGVNPGAPQNPSAFPLASTSPYPIVASMCPGTVYSPLSNLGRPPLGAVIASNRYQSWNEWRLPMLVEPNWEFDPNELLVFTGVPIITTQAILEIMVHVWEFPGWEGCE